MLPELQKRLSPEVKAGVPLAPRTTFKIGGSAEYFFEAKTADDAVRAALVAKELGLPFTILGGGSNMLVSGGGVKGLVVLMANRDIRVEGTSVVAGAGATPGLLAQKTVAAGLAGLEWAVGLPGTLGGGIRGNAGMWGSEFKETVASVRALRDSEVITLTNADCRFGYRDSRFKHEPGWLILEATLQLQPCPNPEGARALLVKYLEDKKARQPIEFPSAGCMFKNWTPPGEKELADLHRAFDLGKDEKIPQTPLGAIPAGWIIDRLGLKGYKVGHAQMSEKHANFLISDGQAEADDVVALASAVKTKVRNATAGIIQLEEEVEYVGF